jgi:DNA-binding transcriptional regulator YhcF (GntR family)
MRKRLTLILIIALTAAISIGAVAYAGSGGRCEGRGGFRSALTGEQRETIHAKVEEMREAGASPEEIHAAVKEMLDGWGIELPQDSGKRHPRHRIFSQLTEEQRETVRAKVEEMREAGASPEEVHAAVKEMLDGWGVDVPEDFGKHPPRHRIFSQLTEEQRQAVHAKVKEMREAGASHEEIHAAVRAMLEGYGIELPEAGQDGEFAPLGASEGQGARWGEIKGRFR